MPLAFSTRVAVLVATARLADGFSSSPLINIDPKASPNDSSCPCDVVNKVDCTTPDVVKFAYCTKCYMAYVGFGWSACKDRFVGNVIRGCDLASTGPGGTINVASDWNRRIAKSFKELRDRIARESARGLDTSVYAGFITVENALDCQDLGTGGVAGQDGGVPCGSRTCTSFIESHTQVDPLPNGFSGKWCGSISKSEAAGNGGCNAFYMFKQNWPGSLEIRPGLSEPTPPISYAIRCIDNPNSNSDAPCSGSPDWHLSAIYCPKVECPSFGLS